MCNSCDLLKINFIHEPEVPPYEKKDLWGIGAKSWWIKEFDIRVMNISNHGRLYINDLVIPHSVAICRNEVEPDFITDVLDDNDMNGLVVLVDYIPVAFVFFKLEGDSYFQK